MFVNQAEEPQPPTNQYLLLRSIFKHRLPANNPTADDQLDRLNKIVAMLKQHIGHNIKQELAQQSVCYGVGDETVRERRAIESMGRARMEVEELRGRLGEAERRLDEMARLNQGLRGELEDARARRREDASEIRGLKERNLGLEKRLLEAGLEKNALEREHSGRLGMRASVQLPAHGSASRTGYDSSGGKPGLFVQTARLQESELPHITKQYSQRIGASISLRYASIGQQYQAKGQQEEGQQEQSMSTIDIGDGLDQSTISVSGYGLTPTADTHNQHPEDKQQREDKENKQNTVSRHDSSKDTAINNRLKSMRRGKESLYSPQKIKFIRQSNKQLPRYSQNLANITNNLQGR